MKNILLRSISGAIYVGLIVGGILAGKWSFLALCALLSGLGIVELNHLHSSNRRNFSQTAIDTIGGIILVAGTWQAIFFNSRYILAAYLLYIISRMVFQLYRTGETPMRDLAYSMLGQMYVALPLALSMFIYAYSPKKSWEGFWGGLTICVIAAIMIETFLPDFFTAMNMLQAIIFSLVAVVFSTWGDLIESMFKRNFDVKDSGHLIPGHGGILDRIDSLLLVIPATLCYLILIG